LLIAAWNHALVRTQIDRRGHDRVNEERETAGRIRVSGSAHKDAVLVEQIEQGVAAVAGAGIADLGVAVVSPRIDHHLGDLMAEVMRIHLVVLLAVARVIVVGDGQVLAEREAVTKRRSVPVTEW
jgi:translation initiation factor 6 (eIF-6)